MSFLNGLGSLASGLGAFSKNSAADQQTRPDDAPAAPGAPPAAAAPAPPAAAATPVPAAPAETPPAAAASAAGPPAPRGAAPSGLPSGVPANLLPIFAQASKQSGIPMALLIAQSKQESGFDVNAVSKTGAIGIAQILPSTARGPGYGLKPVDPATLKDPAVAIAFQAAYLRARAGPGADFSDPRTVDRALAAYNGTGSPGADPNYVANVRAHMGGAS